MATAQTVNYVPNSIPSYAFLSKPPPPQKKRPTQPPPATPGIRSASFSAIATWAAHVQPGSPGSPGSIPRSPRRRSSLSRRPSLSGRRPSISLTLTPSPRSTSHSFLLISTPTPSAKDFNIDLTNLGYTSVFVHLPKTPTTPAAYLTKTPKTPNMTAVNPETFPIPAVPAPSRTAKRFRSLSILRPRNRSGTQPPSPTKSTTRRAVPRSPTKFESPASIAKRKKALYASAKPKHMPLPPSLASELALMQFADGGSMNANIKRLMEAQARAAGETGVGDVYRDGRGGVWWDREEEMEYVHLLGGTGEAAGKKWVSFGGEVKDGAEEDSLALASLAGIGRRDSSTSTNSNTSSLDPSNVIKPAEEDAALVAVPVLAPAPAPKTKAPLLSLPSRQRARTHHLHAKPGFFLLDLEAFNIPSTPRTPRNSTYPHTYTTLHQQKSFSPVRSSFPHSSSPRMRGNARRRPAPLKITPCVPLRDVGVDVDVDGDIVMASDEGRREFLGDSFVPTVPPPAPVDAVKVLPAVRSLQIKKKASRLGLGGLFGRKC